MAIYHQILYVQCQYLKIERKERFVWLKQKKGGWNQIFQPPFIGILNVLLLSPAKLFSFDNLSITRYPADVYSLF